jgi:hypothetical protein
MQFNAEGSFDAGDLTTHVDTRVCKYSLDPSDSSYTVGARGPGTLTLSFSVKPDQPAACPSLLAHLDFVLFDGGRGMHVVNTDDPYVYTGTCLAQ